MQIDANKAVRVQRRANHQVTGAAVTALAAASFIVAQNESALSADHCVTCTSPPATYICQTDLGSSKLANAGARLLCISQLAKRFGHAKCTVRKTSLNEGCLGTIVKVDAEEALSAPPAETSTPDRATEPTDTGQADDGQVPLTAPPSSNQPNPETVPLNPQQSGGAPNKPQKQDTTPASKDAPPKTVEEMAKRAAENSQENLKKAGDAVQGAAKKSWDCLTSLFADC